MVGVAVKVTLAPLHIVVDGLAAIETLAVKIGFTVIVTVFEVAGEPAKQGVAFDVSTQVTVFPFVNVVEEKVGLLVPTLLPLTFH